MSFDYGEAYRGFESHPLRQYIETTKPHKKLAFLAEEVRGKTLKTHKDPKDRGDYRGY